MVATARLLALLLLLSSHAASRPSRRSPKGRRPRPPPQPPSLAEALIAPDDAALSAAQHEGLAEARRTVQDEMAEGVQMYAALAQRAMAAGELEAADKVIAEGMAVVGSAGEEAEFLSGALLMVSASVHRCSNRHADALQAFDRMAELLPVDLDANPERQEGVRSLFRLDLIKLLLASTGGKNKGAAGLRRRRKAEEQALLQLGPWPSLAQLPRDYQRGLRSQPVWRLEESLGGEGVAALLSALAEARPRLVAEHRRLKAQGKMSPERECIHDAAAGQWSQYDFLGGAAAARQRAASPTAVLLDRPQCESGIAPAGCAFVSAVETAVFGRPGSVWAAGLAAGANVLRAGYSALEPVRRALIRSRLRLFRPLLVDEWSLGPGCPHPPALRRDQRPAQVAPRADSADRRRHRQELRVAPGRRGDR